MRGLYVHIPFCERKCNYCDFFSQAGKENLVDDYIKSIEIEIEEKKKVLGDVVFTSLYFGGGTPSFIPSHCIGTIISKLRGAFQLTDDCEVTLEVNPGTVEDKKLQNYYSFGINRLSIGAQSTDDNLLEHLGRIHRRQAIEETIREAKAVGFTNISLDFMYGLPGETLEIIKRNLDFIEKVAVEHISYYGLSVEEGTPYYSLQERGELPLPEEEMLLRMREVITESLEDLGYDHYEISNYGKPGRYSRHNLTYWHNDDYLAIGAGGTTKWNNRRYQNSDDISLYIEEGRKRLFQENDVHLISRREGIEDGIFLGLRLIEGLDLEKFNSRYDVDVLWEYRDVIEKLQKQGCLEIDNQYMRLTKRGVQISNYCLALFL